MTTRSIGHRPFVVVPMVLFVVAGLVFAEAPNKSAPNHTFVQKGRDIQMSQDLRHGLFATPYPGRTITVHLATVGPVVDTAIIRSSVDTTRHTYSFDPRGRRTSDVTQTSSQGGWINTSMVTRSTDDSGNVVMDLEKEWYLGSWQNVSRESHGPYVHGQSSSNQAEEWTNAQWALTYEDTSTFDPGFRLTSTISTWYIPASQSIVLKSSNDYNGSGFLVSTVVEQFINGVWQLKERVIFMNDVHGYDTLYTSQIRVDSQWVNQSQTVFVNDSTGRVLLATDRSWQNNQWVNQRRQTFTYPADRSFHYLSEDWLGGIWVPTFREVEIYDLNGNLTSEVYEYYISGVWVLRSRLTLTYDASAMLVHGVCEGEDGTFYTRDGFGNQYYYSGRSIDISYRTLVTGIEKAGGDTPSSLQLFQNYPNPFNPTTTIRYELSNSAFVTLTVYDVLGQQMAQPVNEQQQAGYYDVEFHGERLASGAYFYRLQTEGSVQMKKLLLLK